MNVFEFITKQFGSVVASLALFIFLAWSVYKAVKGDFFERKAKKREEHEFIKNYLIDLSGDNPPHPYLIESGAFAIFGKNTLNASELLYLFGLSNPTQSIKQYLLAARYMEHSESKKHRVKLRFKKEYTKSRRCFLKWWFTFGFIVFILFAVFSACAGYRLFEESKIVAMAIFVSYVPIFTVMAYWTLVEGSAITKGEFLIKEQMSQLKRKDFKR